MAKGRYATTYAMSYFLWYAQQKYALLTLIDAL